MAEPAERTPLIEVRNLKKWFPIRKGVFSRHVGDVQAVDDISFDIYPRETLGLVGESGCGKTTAGRTLIRLIEPSGGSARYKGVDLFGLDERTLRKYRRDLQIIFQDPYSSLNPRMTIESLIGEALQVHGLVEAADVRDTVKQLLERVGLQGAYVSRYPHEFSGGQRQRIGIARALALKPKFIVCDEAVSALDVSVQAQVINLLQELQDEFDLSYLFIAHDLSVVRHISDRVAVMYLGKIVEIADCDELYGHPAHPYTQALLSAIPEADPRRDKERIILKGDVPTPINPPSGCRFHTRCPAAFGRCRTEVPELHEIASGHAVACHLYTEPARANLTMAVACNEVHELVKAGAEVRHTIRRKRAARGWEVGATGDAAATGAGESAASTASAPWAGESAAGAATASASVAPPFDLRPEDLAPAFPPDDAVSKDRTHGTAIGLPVSPPPPSPETRKGTPVAAHSTVRSDSDSDEGSAEFVEKAETDRPTKKVDLDDEGWEG